MAAIALLIAVGTGVYAGLRSLLPWQAESYGANFAALHTHDLRVSLAPGTYARRGSLLRILHTIPDARAVAAATERLIVTTEVDVERPGAPVLVPGRLVGVAPGAAVDAIATRAGRPLTSVGAVQLEYSFATHFHLPPSGRVRLAGGAVVPYIGLAQSPEDFVVVSSEGLVDASASFAVVYAPLAIAERASGHAGEVDDLVLTLRDRRALSTVRAQLSAALTARGPVGWASVSGRGDITASRVLYTDAHGEQRMYDVFALLLLAGAAFAAFNLISRVVESERRQIGIGMALGASPRALSIRPLLMASEVALLGVAFGVGVGLVLDVVLRGVMARLAPLPFYRTPFEVGVFAQAAAIGFALPFVASLYPVVVGVRRSPIEAIGTGSARTARGAGLAPALRRLPLPGSSLAQLPARNLLRRPGRTLFTVLSLGVVVTILLAILGILDSVAATSSAGEREVAGGAPTRTIVALDGLYRPSAARLRAIVALPQAEATAATLRLGGTLARRHRSVPAIVELIDPASRLWRPTVRAGRGLTPGASGVLISAKAASDLHTGVGGEVDFDYVRPVGGGRYTRAQASLRVLGIHRDPIRTFAFLDASRSGALGYGRLVNTLSVVAAPGVSQGELELALFTRPGVASVEPASAIPDVSRNRLGDFVGIVRVVEAIALGLALLIAFNSTSISAEERAREHATMFAFGLPVRTLVTLGAAESLLVGVLGTLVGILPGEALLHWIVHGYLERTYPELGILISVSLASVGVIVLVGVVAVAVAPALTVRGLRRMNVPARLRTVE